MATKTCYQYTSYYFHHGITLIEVLLSVSLFSAIVTILAGAIVHGRESAVLGGQKVRATYIAEEGLEAVRNLRDESFKNLVPGTHGLTIAGNQWSLNGSSDTVDIFTRSITISDTTPHKKQVVSQVTWQQNPQRSGSVTLTTDLTNWQTIVGGIAIFSDTSQSRQNF